MNKLKKLEQYENAIERLTSKAEVIEEWLEKERLTLLLRSTITSKIDEIENKIANKADKIYHTWEWRHTPEQVEVVFKQMDEATADLRSKLAKINEDTLCETTLL